MGWGSGAAIFDPIARALVEEEASEDLKRRVLGDLIGALQEGDWDTEDESLKEFGDDLVIRSLFYNRGVGNQFDNDWPEGLLAFDTSSRVWTLTCHSCGLIETAEFTAEGHDRLVHEWPRHNRLRHDGGYELDTWRLINPPANTG